MKFSAVKVIFFYHGHFSIFLMSVSCARKLWEKAGREYCMFFHALVAALTKLVSIFMKVKWTTARLIKQRENVILMIFLPGNFRLANTSLHQVYLEIV